MKLVRYGIPGREKAGLIDGDGRLRDLSGEIVDIGLAQLGDDSLAALRALDPLRLPEVAGQTRPGPPPSGVGKFIAIGLNYTDHAKEANMPIPTEPLVFMKATTCIQGPNDAVMLPRRSKKTDGEIELGVVIGRRARYVSEEKTLDHVAGYLTVNDVSEGEFQMERGSRWDKGNGCDTFGPLGPWLVTRDEVPDPQALSMWLDVNERRMQTGNTATMIFSVARIVSYVSEFMTLTPGDVITTGTPPGVGIGLKPSLFLKAGDTMALGIEGLGVQRQVACPSAYKRRGPFPAITQFSAALQTSLPDRWRSRQRYRARPSTAASHWEAEGPTASARNFPAVPRSHHQH